MSDLGLSGPGGGIVGRLFDASLQIGTDAARQSIGLPVLGSTPQPAAPLIASPVMSNTNSPGLSNQTLLFFVGGAVLLYLVLS